MMSAAPEQSSDLGGKLLSQTQRATATLREMIVTNRLAAGSNHLETELAEMLKMSRTPVREALLVLQAQGLVEVRPRRGARILPLSAHDMAEIYQVLTVLEALAAEQAALRGLSQDELDQIEATLDDMESALAVDDREKWAEADRRFHALLVSMSGNRRLQSIVDSFNDQVHRARMLTLRLRPSPLKSNRDHRDLFEAIKSGDAAKAGAIHKTHRMEAKTLIIDLLKSHGFHQV